eukprot:s14060_g1.t1
MAGIATFVVLDRIISRFFGHMMRSVCPGQQPVTLSQIVDADRTLWVLVAQETRGKVLTSGTPLPIDAAVDALFPIQSQGLRPVEGQVSARLPRVLVLPEESPGGRSPGVILLRICAALRQHVELLGYRIQLPPGNLDPVNFACEAPEALAVEAFCGRGRLSVALRDQGLSVLPVDHRVRCTGLQVLRLDLHDDHDVSIFLEMLSSANVCLAHFGPPCLPFAVR